jgi:hypothetical protein
MAKRGIKRRAFRAQMVPQAEAYKILQQAKKEGRQATLRVVMKG